MNSVLTLPADDVSGLTDEHLALRSRIRDELDRCVIPHADEWEARGFVSRQGWRALGSAGLLEFGHDGEDFLSSAVFLEELGRTGYAGIRAAVGVHAYMALSYLLLFGTAEQQEAYVPAARRGERIAALAISEENAGSDLRHLGTRAEPVGELGYRVTGRKCHIANGSQADFFVVLARTGEERGGRGLSGASLVIVDADSPGVSRTPRPMLGWHSADVCDVEFSDVAVPADRLLGRRDKALMHLMRGLDFERLAAGLLAVGGVAHCLELLNRFVRDHQVKDAPLAANQAVRHRIAELDSDLALVRNYAYHAAWLHSRGRLDTRVASILKLKATELAVAAAQTLVQYQGARGYRDEAAAARLHRDAIAGTIAAGASELLRDLIFEMG
ncbi:acyl-CoA dehydrogenase family protein [Actinospica robiniae]|uniref:acyl-CoA dehydrogenase family protein n=1 Tax=Actinospica robiniae TaxID=304901 RepID=UPI0003F75583|nr:acyl-CoA dehydrogenase family protein [Actinospica robiniae]